MVWKFREEKIVETEEKSLSIINTLEEGPEFWHHHHEAGTNEEQQPTALDCFFVLLTTA